MSSQVKPLPSLNPIINNKRNAAKVAISKPCKPIITVTPPDVQMEKIIGKGYGLRATRDFKASELIFIERPLLVTNHAHEQTLEDSVTYAICNANADALIKFYTLHNPLTLWSFWDNARSGHFLSLEENIWNSNCLALPPDPFTPGYHQSAIFELGSRINHSCICNVEWEWDFKGSYMRFYAVSDIKSGDEITIDYLGLPAWRMTAKQRRSELSRDYNFLCRCNACDNELGYWEMKERKERKIPKRYIHRGENFQCDLCDSRGPEDYYCDDRHCPLSNRVRLPPLEEEPSCEWEYRWENLVPKENLERWAEMRKKKGLHRQNAVVLAGQTRWERITKKFKRFRMRFKLKFKG